MKKTLIICSAISVLTSISCFAASGSTASGNTANTAKYSGNVLICASDDNEVKMTADLSDGKKGEKIAIAMLEGIPYKFPELAANKKMNQIEFYPSKGNNAQKITALLVTSLKTKKPSITLTTNPETNKLQVLHDVTEPSPLKISKFKANLTVDDPKLKIYDQEVTCTETKWSE